MNREEALRDLLKALFTVSTLRRWLELVAKDVADTLPEAVDDLDALVHRVVVTIGRLGAADEALFRSLVSRGPERAAEIDAVAKLWGITLGKGLSRGEQVEMLEGLLVERDRHLRDGQVPPDLSARIDALVRAIMGGGRPKAGDEVAGARLLKPVGNGNFGTIWLAEGVDDRAELAVKVFHLEKLAEGVMLWRFRRSVRAMHQLAEDRRAPANIARLHAVAPDTLAFSMPFFKGGNLEDIAKRGWTLRVKLDRFLEICRAVEFAHKVGIIHRDIKPANVVMDADGHPVLTDFDISDIKFATKLSTAGGLGTPIFAAPEQLESGDLADERSDIYSLGRLLHFLLLERSPGYQDERDPALANLSAFPVALVAIVRKACQWDPRRRYADVASLMRDVEQCQSGWAAVVAQARRGSRWVRYNWALLLIAGLISGGSLGAYVWQKRVAENEAALTQQLSEALAQIKALSARQEEIAARGTELATQLAGLKHEREMLAAQRDAPGVSEAERAALAEKISQKEMDIRGIEDKLKQSAGELATLTAQIKAAQDKAERAQRSEPQSYAKRPQPLRGQDRPSMGADPPPGLAIASTSVPTVEPSGGPMEKILRTQGEPKSTKAFLGLSDGFLCLGGSEGFCFQY